MRASKSEQGREREERERERRDPRFGRDQRSLPPARRPARRPAPANRAPLLTSGRTWVAAVRAARFANASFCWAYFAGWYFSCALFLFFRLFLFASIFRTGAGGSCLGFGLLSRPERVVFTIVGAEV